MNNRGTEKKKIALHFYSSKIISFYEISNYTYGEFLISNKVDFSRDMKYCFEKYLS